MDGRKAEIRTVAAKKGVKGRFGPFLNVGGDTVLASGQAGLNSFLVMPDNIAFGEEICLTNGVNNRAKAIKIPTGRLTPSGAN